jgi:hypothetical protein
MESSGWFEVAECAPGAELFRSDRPFEFWARTISHGQTLFRSDLWGRRGAGRYNTRIDLMFKPVTFMKLHQIYHGLVVRCPAEGEAEEIREAAGFGAEDPHQLLVLESDGIFDYLAVGAFGWHEDECDGHEPSAFAGPQDPGGPPWGRRDLFGIDGGLGVNAAIDDVRAAMASADEPLGEPREKYRHVYVLMFNLRGVGPSPSQAHPVGVFLTRHEAESERRRRLADNDNDWWIEATPIAV